MPEPLVFSTAAYTYLGVDIAAGSGWELGQIARKTFPDGEHYLRVDTDPADRDVILVGGTVDDASTLELYDLACGLVTGGAYRLRLVIPFYGYATMERSVRPGEIVTAKTRARLLSSIPRASRGTQVFMLDLHVDSIAHYFEGGVRTIHVYGKQLVTDAARRIAGDDFTLACTDAGRAKWVESLANDLGVDAAFVFKRRLEGNATEVTGVSAQVSGKRVVIYDDMIRTGGSLMNAAIAYREAGAVAIDAIATHGLFPDDSLAKIRASGLFGTIATTDSHPRAVALRDDYLQVASIAGLLIEHLKSNR
ncbi:MAG: ribose-phosphate pyrophosphokinase [Deltaproteobacteria bacterium]|nr:ribose-phosphate pyrophosphokinase [Deltaproteobacteria bacterium]MDQ3301142.1 ribose-phosphate diphosphokinase [Myxococcota bacterium]